MGQHNHKSAPAVEPAKSEEVATVATPTPAGTIEFGTISVRLSPPIRHPRIGETLLYRMTQDDCQRLTDEARRRHLQFNYHGVGQLVPFIAVVLWPGEYGVDAPHGVNGQLLLDGALTMWKTSAKHGEEDGQYSYAN